MKKIIVLAILFCGACSASAQVAQKTYDDKVEEIAILKLQFKEATAGSVTMKNEIDSLSGTINELNNRLSDLKKDLETQLPAKSDSITWLNDQLRAATASNEEMTKTSQKVHKLMKDTIADLKKKLENLEKYKAKKKDFDDQLARNSDSITSLNKQLAEKETQLAGAKQEGDQKIRDAEAKGRNEVLSKITDAYKKPFDELIKSSTQQSVKRDSLLVSDEDTKKILRDLQSYFVAQQVLLERYNEQEVLSARNEVAALEQTELVKGLADKLGGYEKCNNKLKETIDEIEKIDKNFTVNTEFDKKIKMETILYKISEYCDSCSFDYPYLINIMKEIWRQKLDDADISELSKKL